MNNFHLKGTHFKMLFSLVHVFAYMWLALCMHSQRMPINFAEKFYSSLGDDSRKCLGFSLAKLDTTSSALQSGIRNAHRVTQALRASVGTAQS